MSDAQSLDDLFTDLFAAVRDKDRDRAFSIAAVIEQRLFAETREGETVESAAQLQKLSEALAPLDEPPQPLKIDLRLPRRDSRVVFDHFTNVDDNTRSEAASDQKGVDYPVWFATNRKPAGDSFSSQRDEIITRGKVLVHVPKWHRRGEIGSPWWKRLIFGDDRLRVKEITGLKEDAFYAEIHGVIEETRKEEEPEALIFLHGYNTSFEAAAIRAAQIGCDLEVSGPTAFFSWPSRGNLFLYPSDEASIEDSESAIANFLDEFAQNCGAGKIHVIAHSMGNRGLLRALQRINADAEKRAKVRFNQIILAAPDVGRKLFLDHAYLYSAHAQRATLYASRRDLAVFASSIVHSAPRAGYYTPYTVTAGIDTIATPNFNVDLLGHGYFAQAEALLYDISDLFRRNEPPKKRQRIEAFQAENEWLWRFKR